MLKIDVIKFEAQDVITTSILDVNVVPGGAPVNPACYCDEYKCTRIEDDVHHWHNIRCSECEIDGTHHYPDR